MFEKEPTPFPASLVVAGRGVSDRFIFIMAIVSVFATVVKSAIEVRPVSAIGTRFWTGDDGSETRFFQSAELGFQPYHSTLGLYSLGLAWLCEYARGRGHSQERFILSFDETRWGHGLGIAAAFRDDVR